MQAVILAAGKGSRLQPMSEGLPKCLLDIGGKPLIEHQLSALSDNGINEVLVVVGYRADLVRSAVGNKAEFIDNARYEGTNSLYSLWLARDWVKGPFILLNSDLIFHPDVLNRLLKGGGNALAFDSTSSRGLEQTKVVISKGRVIDLGKDIPSEAAGGESIGLLRFDSDGGSALFKRIGFLIDNGGADSWVIEGVRSACSEIRIRGVNIAGLAWAEIDYPGDLERARKEVWPAIHRSYWKKFIYWRRTRWVVAILAVGALIGLGAQLSKLAAPPPISWETISPVREDVSKAKISFIEKNSSQRWWLNKKGGPPFEVEVEGPETVRIEVRLLLPPGRTEPGRYVVETHLNGEPMDWRAFKATPQTHIQFKDYVVGDRDTIAFDVPAGRHVLGVKLLAGTTDDLLVRVRRSQFEEPPDNEDDSD